MQQIYKGPISDILRHTYINFIAFWLVKISDHDYHLVASLARTDPSFEALTVNPPKQGRKLSSMSHFKYAYKSRNVGEGRRKSVINLSTLMVDGGMILWYQD